MHQLTLFFHLAAAIFWMGGMAFVVLALRPVLTQQMAPPQRLPLLATGLWLLLQIGMAAAPPGWHAMLGLGLAMMLVFGHIYFSPYRKLRRAVACADWPEGGRRAGQIATLVKVNLALGWLAIAAVMLWR